MADFRTRQERINATIAEIKNEISATNADIAKTDGRISRTEAEIEETEIEIEETEAKLTKAKQRNDDAKVSKHEAELKKLNKSLKHPIEYVAILQKTRRVQLSLRDQLELSMQKTLSARLQTAAGTITSSFPFLPYFCVLQEILTCLSFLPK